MNQIQKKHKRGDNIKINYKNLNKLTKILLNNIKREFKNNNDKLALFYINIDNKKYYYSYNKINNDIEELYDSYKIVNYKKAKRLLKEQIQAS
ncbi:MAG: hypothetical protein ACI4PE_03905 [Bacilli bacterium]